MSMSRDLSLTQLYEAVSQGEHVRVGMGVQSVDKAPQLAIAESYARGGLATALTPTMLAGDIAKLIEQDFDYVYRDSTGVKTLIKNNLSQSVEAIDPINPNEAEIQLLRYLRGMLLLCDNATDKEQGEALRKTVLNLANSYQYHKSQGKPITADYTHEMADKLADAYAARFDINSKDARKQTTMARDLGILLEVHPVICTISRASPDNPNKICVERSTLLKVSNDYYTGNTGVLQDLSKQPWLISAKRLAGMQPENFSWLENFFLKNQERLVQLGVCAPPSARWLPLPANTQQVELNVLSVDKQKTAIIAEDRYMRTGVIVPYDINKLTDKKSDSYEYQQEIATKIMKELIASRLMAAIQDYKKRYGIKEGQPFDFFIDYQSLLSPLFGEKHLQHTDNNARFVLMAKAVMQSLNSDPECVKIFEQTGARLFVANTNSAVNRHASGSWTDDADNDFRRKLISSFTTWFGQADKSFLTSKADDDVKRAMEVIARRDACRAMSDLLENKPKLPAYQRNIMMAALEHIALGSQGINMLGCKSTRDRTAVICCAIAEMRANPATMTDWKSLEKGIINRLMQGQFFRCMSYHSAVVKVALVHESFMEGLSKGVQKSIKSLLKFSKALDEHVKASPSFTSRFFSSKTKKDRESTHGTAIASRKRDSGSFKV